MHVHTQFIRECGGCDDNWQQTNLFYFNFRNIAAKPHGLNTCHYVDSEILNEEAFCVAINIKDI